MGLEQQKQKTLRSAEGLLRQGKLQEALVVLERMAASSSSDQLTLNRMGDLLARYGRNDEAIGYYFRIAVEFADTGFYPKAVAIHKKILRLNPDKIESLLHLGDLYLDRSLPADARAHLLRAAELQLQAKNFEAARDIYRKLAEAEPGDVRHRVRLAEAIAAEGDNEKAADELLALGRMMLKAGNCPDAERTFRRAMELRPEGHESVLGLCDSLVGQGQDQEALEMLQQAASGEDAPPEVKGALALRYETAGKGEQSLELLKGIPASDVPPGTIQSFFRLSQEKGTIDRCWERFDPILEDWSKQGGVERLGEIYRMVSLIEKVGHIPAIDRWCDLMQKAGDKESEGRAVEALALSYKARSMEPEAEEALERLRKLAPDSALFKKAKAAKSEPPPPEPEKQAQPVAEKTSVQEEGEMSLDIEAPAVPLNRGEEEFATGRLTQAEILDKYGLHDQALQQVREVIERFPGSVEAQEKLVFFLRTANDRDQLQEALIGLALARKAVGDVDEARTAAAEARRIGPLEGKAAEQLEKLGLLQEAEPEPKPEPETEEAVSEPSAEEKREEESEESIVLIDFDAVDDEEEQEESGEAELPMPIPPSAQPIAAAPSEHAEAPSLEASSTPAAPEPQPEALSSPIAEPEAEAPPEPQVAAETSTSDLAGDDLAGDDLAAITAALESDVFAEETETRGGGAEAEQSLDEVFASFRKHVEEEVDSKDFRTHYDLGIAYKEMGFIDEAIAEFEQSSASPDLGREVSIMLAMCYRDKGETNRAIACYRQAIDLPGAEPAAMNGLRYELAELLLESGDGDTALELFQAVKRDDPSFRDIDQRVQRLEADLAG